MPDFRPLTHRKLAILISLAFFLLAAGYSIITPIFESPDELWHYPLVWHLAQTGQLPVQEPARPQLWRQEGSQPPLYYALAALLTAPIPADDLPQLIYLNPHADIGLVSPDGNANVVVHTGREAWPWRGAVLALHLARLFSVLLGTGTVLAIYALGRLLGPDQPALALAAMAFVAFNPMFLFIAGSVNNDNLITFLAALTLWRLISLLVSHSEKLTEDRGRLAEPSLWRFASLGVLVGLASLAKLTGLGLLGLAGLTLLWWGGRRRSWRTAIVGNGLVGLLALLIAGWWYWRNFALYGDWTGTQPMIEMMGARPVPPTPGQLLAEASGLLRSFWGLFGYFSAPMPSPIYWLLNSVLALGLAGLLGVMVKSWLGNKAPFNKGPFSKGPSDRPEPEGNTFQISPPGPPTGGVTREIPPSGGSGGPLSPHHANRLPNLKDIGSKESFPDRLPSPLRRSWPVLAVWLLLVFMGLVQWTLRTPASQGRLLFPALPALAILWAAGWISLVPRGWRALPLLAMFVLAVWVPGGVIRPAYARPAPLALLPPSAQPLSAAFGQVAHLLGYESERSTLQPGQTLLLTLYWQSGRPVETDYTVFIHLLDEHDLIIAQRDVFHGPGVYPTSQWSPDRQFADTYALRIPTTTPAPAPARFEVGLFDRLTGVRLPLSGGGDSLRFGSITLRPRPGPWPNSQALQFEDDIWLVGYRLDRQLAAAGDNLGLTLYWQGRRPPSRDYKVFVHLVGSSADRIAQHDSEPQNGAAPTSGWQPQQVIEDSHRLTIRPDAPPGAYRLHVGLYEGDTGRRLRLLRNDGQPVQANSVTLAGVRVTAQ